MNRSLQITGCKLQISPAFTLIEILVVIAIILVIATIGIGSYSAARRSMVINLETDKLVANLHSLRDSSRAISMCEGIRFVKDSPPRKIQTEYKNAVSGCDIAALRDFEMNFSPDVAIKNNLTVLFVPPHGSMYFGTEDAEAEITIAMKARPDMFRTIHLNRLTGMISF